MSRVMKDSGIELIGDIPTHWEVKRVKNILNILTDFTSNGSFADLAKNVEYQTEGFSRLIRLTDIRENLNNQGLFVSESAHNYLKKSELFGEEILIANVGAYAGLCCMLPKINFKATLGPNMFLLKFKNINPKYVFYWLLCKTTYETLSQIANSTAQPKLNKNDIKTLIFINPTPKEQEKIVSYLDIETSKIDKKIDIISQKVDKLEEYKQSIIFETVTKGLDNYVPMKDSGIEWIGDIPAHWEVKRVKEVFNYLGKSDMPSGDGELVGIYDFYVSGSKLKKSNKANLNTAALLLPTGGTYMVHFPKNIPCAYSTDVLPLTTVSLNINYGYYFLISNKKYFDKSYFSGMGIKHLQREVFFNSLITIPTKEEQEKIANFLDAETSKIDKQKELLKKKIELLREYKQSLIYEAVTGKLEIVSEYE